VHKSVMQFAEELPIPKGLTILEIGSYDVNGSVRSLYEKHASKYVGCDIEAGKGVDIVVDKDEDLIKRFGKKSFDLVVCTEVLEHAEDWRKIVSEVKQIASKYILVTTRSVGFPYHAFPTDCWRYSLDDITHLFDEYDIQIAKDDPEAPGVMLFAKRPKRLVEKDLSNYELTPAPTV
jgi:hypothetical protein